MSGIPLSSLNIHGEGFHFTVIEQDVKHQSGEAAWYPGNTRLISCRTRPGSTLEALSPNHHLQRQHLWLRERIWPHSLCPWWEREREKETELGLELKHPDQSGEWNFSAPSPGIRNRSHQKIEDLSSSLKIKEKKKSYTWVKNEGTKNTPSHRFSIPILGKTSLWR